MSAESASPIRPYAVAFLAATVASLVVDAVLQLALDAMRVSSHGGGAPWWITANLVPRGRWVTLAALLWWLGPRLISASPDGSAQPLRAAEARLEAWRRVGVGVMTMPLLWVLATWLVTAVRFTLLGSWLTDGRVFLAPEYYRGLSVEYVPWLLAGAAVLGIRRHLG